MNFSRMFRMMGSVKSLEIKAKEPMPTFATWQEFPENRSALTAIRRLGRAILRGRTVAALNPLYLHGPSGSGKSHLLAALAGRITRAAPDRIVNLQTARDLVPPTNADLPTEPILTTDADLVIVEDLQHLAERAIETLVHLVDHCQRRHRPLVVTATSGPAELITLPTRLASRLASGLVVRLEPLGPHSRRQFLQWDAQRRGLDLPEDALDWLAENLPGSGRQLAGTLNRLETLNQLDSLPLTLDRVRIALVNEAPLHRPTVERIAACVSAFYRVEPRLIRSPRRSRGIVLPRQVGMYLARRFTGLSLDQIGAYFGGRDHSTVLHACRKVEQALAHDLELCGAVRQLQAEIA